MVYTSTITRSLLTASGIFIGTYAIAQTDEVKTRSIIKSTVRVHSSGMFLYGGRVACHNPVADINFVCERKGWGFLTFKAVDLTDHKSPYNFMMTSVYRYVHLSKTLTFTPYLAAFLEQQEGFADKGSELSFIGTTTWKPNSHLAVDYTMLLANLIAKRQAHDWVSRLRATYSIKHVDATATFWYNSPAFDHENYSSGAIAIAYSRVKVSKHLMLSVSATDIGMIATSDQAECPKQNRLILSVALQYTR